MLCACSVGDVFPPSHSGPPTPTGRCCQWWWSAHAVRPRSRARSLLSSSDLPADDGDRPRGPDRGGAESLQRGQAGSLWRAGLTGLLCGQRGFHRHLRGCVLLRQVRAGSRHSVLPHQPTWSAPHRGHFR